jgi:hypothetical protein
MKATVWFRVSAIVLLLFAAGHTFGFLAFKPPSAEGLAVLDAMNRVHFQLGHSSFSYGHFYVGFGLFITASQLFAAFLAWHLGAMARRGSPDVAVLGWSLVALQLASVGISLVYISAKPAVLSAAIAVCLAMGAHLARRRLA